MSPSPAIVVVTYNRPKSLARLLTSIAKATYPNTGIDLIISIDYSENNEPIQNLADNFKWKFGNKKVLKHQNNLGLRKHIINCGEFSLEYGSVIILEDDLYVSPNYYEYTCKALQFAKNKTYIGGISLYNHKTNVHTNEYFAALEDGFDNWYFQFASSWGQAWDSDQWSTFKKWYDKRGKLKRASHIPENVTNWSEKSWLKYFITYLIETNKFFLYPKISRSTNFNDAGTHASADSTIYQTELFFGTKSEFKFSELKESLSVYDAFYENINLADWLTIDKNDISIDLYGKKIDVKSKKYLLSSKLEKFRVIQGYSRSLKPIELNIIENNFGHDIFLYDQFQKAKKPKYKNFYNRKITYSTKHLPIKWARQVFVNELINLYKYRFQKLKKIILNHE